MAALGIFLFMVPRREEERQLACMLFDVLEASPGNGCMSGEPGSGQLILIDGEFDLRWAAKEFVRRLRIANLVSGRR